MLRVLKILTGLVAVGTLLAGLGLGGLFLYGKQRFEAPGPAAPNGGAETTVVLDRGLGLGAIARRLEAAGLITRARLFSAGARLMGRGGDLKAGEYAIPSGASMADILDILTEGKSILHRLTVPEGYSVAQVVDLLKADPVLEGVVEDLPEEGTLLPETYLFQRGTTRMDMLERMKEDKRAVLDRLWADRAEDLPFDTPFDALILASIVEKETGIADERPLVASVFVNRLRKGMRLQSDPTVIYPITKGRPLGRRIRRSDLEADNPYNTYVKRGLPPTPIANPGRASLAAVLNPPQTDYLYFVADGSGGHVFAKTLKEHNANVAKWRRVQKERGLR